MITSPRGFTLLIAVILTSVLLSVGLALLDIAYKQVVLSSTAKQSQTAFYAADSALECALYWDQQQIAFSYNEELSSITCRGVSLPVTSGSSVISNVRRSTFSIAYPDGSSATVEVFKGDSVSSFCSASKTTCIYANGHNTAASDPRRIERSLKALY